MRYLAQRGIRPQQRDLFIVDIGWRGTIQDNLAYLLPNTHITGCYLGLLNLLNEQPPNVEKLCYGPDESRDPPHVAESIRFVSPLEMLANTGAGSVHGYADQDGRVVAIRDAAAHENHVHTCYTQHFQQGVLAAVGMISDWVRTYAISAAEMRPLCLRLLARFARDPPRILARAFFDLSHNETFGVGRYVQRRRWFPYGLAALGLFSRRWRGELVRRLEQTGWPQGFLKLHRLDRLCARYNRAVDKRFGQR
jgi:hypothetical protein